MYAGNASVINFLMRWPVLIPVAAAGVAVPLVVKEEAPPAPVVQETVITGPGVKIPEVLIVPPVVEVAPERPAPRKLEELCPPVADTAKMSRADKAALRNRGCKVAG